MPKKRDSDFGTWRQFAQGLCFCPAAFGGKEESDEDPDEVEELRGQDRVGCLNNVLSGRLQMHLDAY